MKKILIVYDDIGIRKSYSMFFSDEGYEVILASDGNEGFEKAKKYKPDLIISDFYMPNLNGKEMVEKLKADSDTTDIPVIGFGEFGIEDQSSLDYFIPKFSGAKKFCLKSIKY